LRPRARYRFAHTTVTRKVVELGLLPQRAPFARGTSGYALKLPLQNALIMTSSASQVAAAQLRRSGPEGRAMVVRYLNRAPVHNNRASSITLPIVDDY
jgi:hypothetical protein